MVLNNDQRRLNLMTMHLLPLFSIYNKIIYLEFQS